MVHHHQFRVAYSHRFVQVLRLWWIANADANPHANSDAYSNTDANANAAARAAKCAEQPDGDGRVWQSDKPDLDGQFRKRNWFPDRALRGK